MNDNIINLKRRPKWVRILHSPQIWYAHYRVGRDIGWSTKESAKIALAYLKQYLAL